MYKNCVNDMKICELRWIFVKWWNCGNKMLEQIEIIKQAQFSVTVGYKMW